MIIRRVINRQDMDGIINDHEKSVAVFVTSWCGLCMQAKQEAAKLEDVFPFVVDLEEMPELGSSLNIENVPCFIDFENGKRVSEPYYKLKNKS